MNEDYDFFRKEKMFVQFKVFDNENSGEPVTGVVRKVELVSPGGGRINLNYEYQTGENYRYSLEIPATHDFIGLSQIFTFAFDFNDESGGESYVDMTIRNNPPVINGTISDISIIGNTSYTLDLSGYESDIEDSGSYLTWEAVNKGEDIFDAKIEDKTLIVTPKKTGTGNLELILKDFDQDSDKTEITINVKDILQINNIECHPKIVENSSQYCSVNLASELEEKVGGAEVKFYDAETDEYLGECFNVTDWRTSGCSGMFKTGKTPGNYGIYAKAFKSGHENDTDKLPLFNYEVVDGRYILEELKIYNDENYSVEDYDFFRNEKMFVKFKVFDKINQEYVSNIVTEAVLVSPPSGRAELDQVKEENQSYYYELKIPAEHLFKGISQVFTFAFNTTDNTGGQKYVNLTIRNNPPVIKGVIPDVTINDSKPVKIDLTVYESDIEDSGKDLNWKVLDADNKVISVQINDEDELTLIPGEAGSDMIKLELYDLDYESDSQWINVTNIIQSEIEPVPIPEDIYPRRSMDVRHIRLNGLVYPEIKKGGQIYVGTFFENIGNLDIGKATFRVTCYGLGISRKSGPFIGPETDEGISSKVLLDVPKDADEGIYTCRASITTNEGLRRTKHRDILIV